jgi:hypothetical protein
MTSICCGAKKVAPHLILIRNSLDRNNNVVIAGHQNAESRRNGDEFQASGEPMQYSVCDLLAA